MAAKLILSMDGSVLREYPLNKERVTVGRKPQNDIVIDNLAVSGHHAAIVTILNDSFLEDTDSTNGVMVNGAPVKKHFLQNNDVIEIGKYRLKYINETRSQPSSTDYEKTMVLRMPAGAATPQPEPPPAVPQPAPAPTAAVRVLSGPAAGRELVLVKNLTTLGKVGVQVAALTRRPQGYFISHVEGASRPLLNGAALDDQPHLLNDRDVIGVAGVEMEFYFKD